MSPEYIFMNRYFLWVCCVSQTNLYKVIKILNKKMVIFSSISPIQLSSQTAEMEKSGNVVDPGSRKILKIVQDLNRRRKKLKKSMFTSKPTTYHLNKGCTNHKQNMRRIAEVKQDFPCLTIGWNFRKIGLTHIYFLQLSKW